MVQPFQYQTPKSSDFYVAGFQSSGILNTAHIHIWGLFLNGVTPITQAGQKLGTLKSCVLWANSLNYKSSKYRTT